MKLIVFHGSPRPDGSTAQMIQALSEGVRQAQPDAEIQVVRLYDYTYTGCKSCFACQKGHSHCLFPDDIHEILNDALQADGLVFASPIYFMDVSAQMKAFLERLMYPGAAEKVIPSVMIFTMKASEEMRRRFHIEEILASTKTFLAATLRQEPVCLYAYRADGEGNSQPEGFRSPAAMESQGAQQRFQMDLHHAREAGTALAERIRHAKNQ